MHDAVREIRDDLVAAHHRGQYALGLATLTGWHGRLHRVLTAAAHGDPSVWRQWFSPGTWLESHVRLYMVLGAVVAEAERAGLVEVEFAAMSVPSHLGWPEWALPVPEEEAVAQ